jgi:cytochrome c553
MKQIVALAFVTCLFWASKADAAELNSIQFNRDIRPILSENCYACHGPDKNSRKAGLLLYS